MIAAGLIVVGIAGVHYILSGSVTRGLSLGEAVPWIVASGVLVLSCGEALFLVLHVPTRPEVMAAALVLIVLGSLRRLSQCQPAPDGATRPREGRRWFWRVCLAGSVVGVTWFALRCLTMPVVATDFLAVWGFKGRLMYATAAIPARLFHDPALAWGHPEYPLMLPLLYAALASLVGHWSPGADAIVSLLSQALAVLLAYGWIGKTAGRDAGAAAAFLTALSYSLYSSSNIYLADIPLAFGFLLLASAMNDIRTRGQAASFSRLATAALLCCATKKEGSLLVFVALLASLVTQPGPARVQLRAWISGGTPVVLHALLMRVARGAVASRDIDLALVWPQPQWMELLERVRLVALHLATVEVPVLLPALVLAVLLISLTKRTSVDWIWLAVAVQAFCYLVAAVLSRFGPAWQIESAFSRIYAALWPLLACALAARLGADQRISTKKITIEVELSDFSES